MKQINLPSEGLQGQNDANSMVDGDAIAGHSDVGSDIDNTTDVSGDANDSKEAVRAWFTI